MSPKEVRKARGLARFVVAARAGVSDLSAKAYEANPVDGVTAPIKSKLDVVYTALATGLTEGA